MSSFNSQLHQLSEDPSAVSNAGAGATASESASAQQQQQHRHNPHAIPTPVDIVGLVRLVQDQFSTLAQDAPDATNRDLLRTLFEALEADVLNPPREVDGVSQEFLDTLERVPKKALRPDDACPICAEKFLDDPYPLVVELQCHHSHRFDLDCVGPWLQIKGTCPMCRTDLKKYDPRRKGVSERIENMWKREGKPVPEEEEEEDPDMLYG